jgi:hypothetical protein
VAGPDGDCGGAVVVENGAGSATVPTSSGSFFEPRGLRDGRLRAGPSQTLQVVHGAAQRVCGTRMRGAPRAFKKGPFSGGDPPSSFRKHTPQNNPFNGSVVAP